MEEDMSRQARAAETKKARTRDRLLQAADEVMRTMGMDATVEAIASQAGLSTATFYSFYTSRNMLCMYAFTVLVVHELEDTVVYGQPVESRVEALATLVEGRKALVRAALIGRLELGYWNDQHDPEPPLDARGRSTTIYGADFVDQLSYCLYPHSRTSSDIPSDQIRRLHSLALELLDLIATGQDFTLDTWNNATVRTMRRRTYDRSDPA